MLYRRVFYYMIIRLPHWDLNKIPYIFQMTFPNVFRWMKIMVFWFKFRQICSCVFHWKQSRLVPRCHQAISHRKNQCWPTTVRPYGVSHYPIARPPHQPPVILSGTPELGWAQLTCGCWQISSILANIGHRNSIRILNQYPFWWNISIRSWFISFIKFLSF